MKEPQIESAYRARFDGARRSELALQQIYEDMVAAVTPTPPRCWLELRGRDGPQYHAGRRDTATPIADRATLLARWWLSGLGEYGPLEHIDIYPDRPTLGGLYMPPKAAGDTREAHAVVLDDGSVGLSWRAGGHPHEKTNEPYAAHQIPPLASKPSPRPSSRSCARSPRTHTLATMKSCSVSRWPAARAGHPSSISATRPPPSGVHRPLNPQFRPVRIIADPATNDHDFIQAPDRPRDPRPQPGRYQGAHHPQSFAPPGAPQRYS